MPYTGYTPPTEYEIETDYARRYIPWAHEERKRMDERLRRAFGIIDDDSDDYAEWIQETQDLRHGG